jgi:hypothetical protein
MDKNNKNKEKITREQVEIIKKYSNEVCEKLNRYKIDFIEWQLYYQDFIRLLHLNIPGFDYIKMATSLLDSSVNIKMTTEQDTYDKQSKMLATFISKAQQSFRDSFRDSLKNYPLYKGLDGKDYYEYGDLLAANQDYVDHYYQNIKISDSYSNLKDPNKR